MTSRSPLAKPLGVLMELDDIARAVRGDLPPFGFRGVHRHQPREFPLLAGQLAGVAEPLADFPRDAPGLGMRRADHQHIIPRHAAGAGQDVIGGDGRMAFGRVGDLGHPAHAGQGVEALGRLPFRQQLSRRPVRRVFLPHDLA